jgi:hypothetical protein
MKISPAAQRTPMAGTQRIVCLNRCGLLPYSGRGILLTVAVFMANIAGRKGYILGEAGIIISTM